MSAWTSELESRVRDMWENTTLSAGQIAAELAVPGVTRNSVISRAHMRKWKPRRGPSQGRPRTAVDRVRPSSSSRQREARLVLASSGPAADLEADKPDLRGRLAEAMQRCCAELAEPSAPVPAPAILAAPAAPAAEGVRLLEASHRHCRWPVSGEGADMRVCGAQVVGGKVPPYCEQHMKMRSGGPGGGPQSTFVFWGRGAKRR